jgi:peptidase M28-like protein
VSAPERIDLLDELDALLDLGRRTPGSDAERRAALHLRDRLTALGRSAEVEPVDAHPAWPLAYAALAGAAVGAGVLAVYVPLAGALLALAAALLTFLDAGVGVPLARRPLGRRASQNVISWGGDDKPGALVLVAHVDAPRGGLARSDPVARRWRGRLGGLQLLFWAQLGVLACALVRLAGLEGTALSILQFIPMLVLIVAVALLIDVALSPTRGGENDNASGCVAVLALARRAAALPHLNLHVLFSGAQHAGAAGMRAFLKRHDLPAERTVFLNVSRVGSGEVRYTRREGALVGQRSHPQLTALCEQIVEDDLPAAPLNTRESSDAAVAGARGYAAITVTCRDRGDYASGRVEERSLDAAVAFCAELIERVDAEVGPSLAAPVAATALSEPD